MLCIRKFFFTFLVDILKNGSHTIVFMWFVHHIKNTIVYTNIYSHIKLRHIEIHMILKGQSEAQPNSFSIPNLMQNNSFNTSNFASPSTLVSLTHNILNIVFGHFYFIVVRIKYLHLNQHDSNDSIKLLITINNFINTHQ